MLGRGLGRCELCGSSEAIQASHRVGRAQGGLWTPPNVLALCARDHAWLTEHRDVADAGGWIVKDLDLGADPTTVPVWLNSAGLWPAWFALDGDGDAHPLDEDRPPPAVFPPTLAA